MLAMQKMMKMRSEKESDEEYGEAVEQEQVRGGVGVSPADRGLEVLSNSGFSLN